MKPGECIFNPNIECNRYKTNIKCCTNFSCGWNPPVAKARSNMIRFGGKRALVVEQQQATNNETEKGE